MTKQGMRDNALRLLKGASAVLVVRIAYRTASSDFKVFAFTAPDSVMDITGLLINSGILPGNGASAKTFLVRVAAIGMSRGEIVKHKLGDFTDANIVLMDH